MMMMMAAARDHRTSEEVMMMMAAAQDQSHLSLLNLEDELSCSICLSTFDCPVTIPCGHNFCQDCLLATWKDSYSCPQCRTVFATKPELKKNTVLSTVAESFRERASRSREEQKEERGARREEEQEEEEERGARREEALIRCDTCMEAEASHTCLTCMASFCEEHLRPHRENPVFRLHQLGRPVGDLSERICPDHHKLMELFCCQHDRPICSLCLQQVHKGCSFTSPEEQRSRKEAELRNQLHLLDEKIEKTEKVRIQTRETHNQLKDAAQSRKLALASVYQQMMDLVSQDQREAQLEVDRELELSQTRLQNHMKTLSGNSEKMRTARERITSLLSGSHTAAFLQASFDLPKVVKSDPHVARIHLDSKKVTATQSFAAALVDSLTEVLKQPVEDRSLLLTAELSSGSEESDEDADSVSSSESTGPGPEPGVTAAPVPGPAGAERTRSQPEPGEEAAPVSGPERPRAQSEPGVSSSSLQTHEPPEQIHPPPGSQGPAPPSVQLYFQPVPIPFYSYAEPHPGWSHSPFPEPYRGPSKPRKSNLKKEKKTICKPAHKVTSNKSRDRSQTLKPKGKKSETSHQPSTKPDKKPPSAAGPGQPGATGSDKPKSHTPPPSKSHAPNPPKSHAPNPPKSHTPPPSKSHAPNPPKSHTPNPKSHAPNPPKSHTPNPPKSHAPNPSKSHTPNPPKSHAPNPSKSHTPNPPKSHAPNPPKSHTPNPPKSHAPNPPKSHAPPPSVKSTKHRPHPKKK